MCKDLRRTLAFTSALWLLAGSGCQDRIRRIDPFPVTFDHSSGAVVAAAQFGDGDPIPVVLDTLSPVTIRDDDSEIASRQRLELRLYGVDDEVAPTVPRALYTGTVAYELHPCGDQTPCAVGVGDDVQDIGGVIGFDVLARGAVTFDFPTETLTLSPDVAGDNPDRRRSCEAEFPNPFAGGGTLRIAGNDQPFASRRAALRTCLGPGEGLQSEDQGVSALLVAATGSPISLLSISGYERYRAAFPGTPAASQLPEEAVDLATGRVSLRIAEIPGIALVGQPRGENGACRELYANRLMAAGGCSENGVRLQDCPCPDEDGNRGDPRNYCRASAAILMRQTVRFGLVPDESPLLQALRDELRPALPEVDGLIGAADLRYLRVAFDYPNGRILMRCEEPGVCRTRPVVVSREQAEDLTTLCPMDPGPPDTADPDPVE